MQKMIKKIDNDDEVQFVKYVPGNSKNELQFIKQVPSQSNRQDEKNDQKYER